MSTSALIAHQARYDLKVFVRDPRARGFTLAMPVLLLVIFGSLFRSGTVTEAGVTLKYTWYYVPRMIVLGIVSAGLSTMLISLVAKRESGALKRRRATPIAPAVLIGGDLITVTASGIVIGVVVTVIGWVAFSVHPGGTGLVALLLVVIVGTAAFCALGYALTPFVKSLEAAGPLVMLLMFTLNAVSGIYIPENQFPHWLVDAAQVLPIRPLAVAMESAFVPAINGGSAFAWPDLGIVLAWGVFGVLVAARRFTWTPSQQ